MPNTGLEAAAGTFAGVDLAALAEREGTPLYVYSAGAIRARLRALLDALAGLDAGICYAVKANSNVAILALLLFHLFRSKPAKSTAAPQKVIHAS